MIPDTDTWVLGTLQTTAVRDRLGLNMQHVGRLAEACELGRGGGGGRFEKRRKKTRSYRGL